MAGRIRDEDIAAVREKARIDDVISAYVTLRSAGGGNFKGLCPFHDEKSPSFNVTPARGMYHCLAGETEVLTFDGTRPIRELAGGTHRILGARANWIDAPFKSYGVQPLMKITMTRNRQVKEIFATDEHRWFVRTANTSPTPRKEVLTKDLRPGDRLSYKYPRNGIQRTVPSPFGIAHGFTFGDGTLNGNGAMALLCPPKDLAMLKWFPNSVTSASGKNLLVHHLPTFFTEWPDLDESHSYLYGWLAGYFAADGCVAADGTVILNSAKRENLEFVRAVCTRLGIATYGVTSQNRRGIDGRMSDLFRVHLVNEDLTSAFFLIPTHLERFEAASKQYSRRGWVVRSVEQTDRVEEVFCAEVEDGHAFTLADNILTGNCFGCGVGGDVIKFVMEIDGTGFTETVERLAEKFGVELRYEEGGPSRPSGGPQRPRLVEAHKLTAAWYAEQLATPDAMTARQFLDQRGFDKDAAEHFGVGFSPRGGDELVRYLKQKGFTDGELVSGGLAGDNNRGLYDKFRGRLMWPIRDSSGDVIGFGARRIFEDDRIEAKYLNTAETPIYKKSQVLYGIDLARREIARGSQAVIVEGYTDVMACHLSGVKTAVATCGTAFGDDHARVIRRLLQDHDEFRGEVIFTFDGDAAGQKAALRAFEGDQNFAGQTYVAVEPSGKDPCDLRLSFDSLAEGEAAVRELVARRVPLYRFVLGNVVERYDLDRADGRVDALREAAKLVRAIRDRSKVDAFARELAGMVGIDEADVIREVRRAANREQAAAAPAAAPAPAGPQGLPDPRDPRFLLERETLKLVVQHPGLIGPALTDVGEDDFTHPAYRAVWAVVTLAGGVAAADAMWSSRLQANTADERVQSLLSALSVEPLPTRQEPTAEYAAVYVHRLRELTAMRRIADLKSKLQRTNPVDDAAEYNRMFGELVALEQHRRTLRELAVEQS